jgi:hypothetical protein
MRALAAVLSLLAACDFVSNRTSPRLDGGAGDGDGGSGDVDGRGGVCSAWELTGGTAKALELMDAMPVDTARSLRIAVTTELAACEERAMPEVAIDADELTVTIALRVWRQVEGDCGEAAGSIARPVLLRLPEVGTWTISAEGAEPLSLKVDPGPGGQCGEGDGECVRDCDCDAGEACLRGVGVGGPYNSCSISCELDRDCGGQGICLDVDDGLDRVCVIGDECNQQGNPACPDGYSCDLDSDSCTPSFSLDEESRGACACDYDCEWPLRCVQSRDGEPHCELTCQTGGPWCQGSHVCGAAADDAAQLATTDSVCISSGE